MKTIYESESGKQFETEQEAKEADKQYLAEQKKNEAAKEQRKADAQIVTDAFKDAAAAQRKAREEMQEFIDKYGSFHETFTGDEAKDFFTNPFDTLFDFLSF